ncbi:hypothetical protein [Comamonas odontotermitis]|uniref:hypothetical protein n=1 Tax=Comamonas odontotermitis TaxID=379895 RepID=UPI003753BD66
MKHYAALPGARHLGYGSDISAHAHGFVVSCPRADLVTRWRMPQSAGQAWSLMDTTTLAGAYCVSNARDFAGGGKTGDG